MDRRAHRARAGFTLVEIMIVLAILVLLIAMGFLRRRRR
ncbi:prepilin-type N-terminal cleavage/methylation domain-containing protein [Planctomycetota bacterium]